MTARARELHVFGASERGTTLYHTVRDEEGNWPPSWAALRSFASIRQITTTRVGSTIGTAVATDGQLRYSIQASDGTWGGWVSVGSKAGEIGGFYQVALAGLNGQHHVFALNGSGGVYHEFRRTDGSWRQFRSLSVFDDCSPFELCAANVGGEIHVGIIELTDSGIQAIRCSIRRTDGSWRSVGTVSGSGLADQPGILAVGGTKRILQRPPRPAAWTGHGRCGLLQERIGPCMGLRLAATSLRRLSDRFDCRIVDRFSYRMCRSD